MKMKCPFCELENGLTTTHRHLVEAHLDVVIMQRNHENGKMQYIVECPFCDLDYMREIKPRNRNPRFLEEFRAEIAMVAFDQLLYHVLQEHPAEVGVDPASLGLT